MKVDQWQVIFVERDFFHVESAKNNIRQNFFLNRIIPVWNQLSENIKEAKKPRGY